MANGHVLVRFAFGIKKRNYRRVHPVDAAVLRAIAKLTLPDSAATDRGPKIADELFRVITRIDDAVILTQQFFA